MSQMLVNYPTPKVNPIRSITPDAEIIRIDFELLEGGRCIVNKFGKGIKGNLFVVDGQNKPGFDLETALAWCKQNGWTVRRWPGGARAWKRGPEPVRGSHEIIRLRDQLRENPRPELEGMGAALDLAYDL